MSAPTSAQGSWAGLFHAKGRLAHSADVADRGRCMYHHLHAVCGGDHPPHQEAMQLPGLAERYVGKLGAVLVFISVCANSIGCMISYTSGSGNILCELLGLPPAVGSLLFTIPAVLVVWFGLKATGLAEKFLSSGMIVLLAVIIGVSFFSARRM